MENSVKQPPYSLSEAHSRILRHVEPEPATSFCASQFRLVTQIEELLGLQPGLLSCDPLVAAKIFALDPYLLQSCCEKGMLVTLLAMLRSAGITEADAQIREPRGAKQSHPMDSKYIALPNVTVLVSGTYSKPPFVPFMDSFETSSVDTAGLSHSPDESDFEADSLMEYDYIDSTSPSVKDEVEKLDTTGFKLRGAVGRLHYQTRDFSDNLDISVKKIQNLEDQNKWDLDYLHRMRESSNISRDKACELKAEISDLGNVFELITVRKESTTGSMIKQFNDDGSPTIDIKVEEVEPPKNETKMKMASFKEAHAGTNDKEPENPLEFFINYTIFLLVVACWLWKKHCN